MSASVNARRELTNDTSGCENANATLRRQSPIDLPSNVVAVANQANYSFVPLAPVAGTVAHYEDTIKTFWKAGSNLTINGRTYTSAQFHHHAPSEHTIDGLHFDLELHFVHSDASGNLAVLGVFFHVDDDAPDAHNPFLDQFVPGFGLLEQPHDNYTLPLVSAQGFGFEAANVFRYEGSLTTPPYTEGVAWSVSTEVQRMSEDQFDAFKHVIEEENFRPTQCANGRDIALIQTW
ncbi:Aste57867_990 [Aphanomyces stellatus]|uniref:Carbonic anhydrase n=1 Tax=Aphanomyces stellatus TaxID=120398 RepID=A0A485K6P9_9STRA|nr:hypothetical protein As57867_000989 [Aphanomyces stellatus]VFT78212.1 Aste57867_990 [Aphanomyces stellatus]